MAGFEYQPSVLLVYPLKAAHQLQALNTCTLQVKKTRGLLGII